MSEWLSGDEFHQRTGMAYSAVPKKQRRSKEESMGQKIRRVVEVRFKSIENAEKSRGEQVDEASSVAKFLDPGLILARKKNIRGYPTWTTSRCKSISPMNRND
ncbi:hypothetical protein K0M31_004343 [Melipona bicolor]|uniref:Uncharacterized protein n=1 Tax=Melipona bicolor TaxID=60889 RepID=A0AA40FWL0_9HYME|nr:hypothetical protein K0M31_004343 [Melipona bicolor]